MFEDFSVAANVAIFVASSVAVWLAGSRVARDADRLQSHTGIGEALIGVFLLGFVSALPEFAVTVSAAWAGNPHLAANNLLGGMALNVSILAAADAVVRREALTASVATPTPLLQAALLIVLLSVVAAGTLIGEAQLFGIDLWSWAILAIYLACARLIHQTRGEQWVPSSNRVPPPRFPAAREPPPGRLDALLVRLGAGAAVILVAGYLLSAAGDALSEQTGLGGSFFGAVFLALSTSLPEISIVFAAVRIGRYEMAISDIFGANLFGLALLFVVDLVYDGGPLLAQLGRFSTFAALLGIAVTALFVAGLVERSHRRVLRMGIDSIAVLGAYAIGLVLLYTAR